MIFFFFYICVVSCVVSTIFCEKSLVSYWWIMICSWKGFMQICVCSFLNEILWLLYDLPITLTDSVTECFIFWIEWHVVLYCVLVVFLQSARAATFIDGCCLTMTLLLPSLILIKCYIIHKLTSLWHVSKPTFAK